jgi:hypothetical protein
MRHVQLKEPRSLPVRGTHIFDRSRARSGQTVWQIQFLRDLSNRELPERVVDLVYANGREADGGADFVTEDRGFRVPKVRVDEHARYDTMTVEGLSICEVGVGLACV